MSLLKKQLNRECIQIYKSEECIFLIKLDLVTVFLGTPEVPIGSSGNV
jgi:hypothetical protein